MLRRAGGGPRGALALLPLPSRPPPPPRRRARAAAKPPSERLAHPRRVRSAAQRRDTGPASYRRPAPLVSLQPPGPLPACVRALGSRKCIALPDTAWECIARHCTRGLECIALHFTALPSPPLPWSALHCIALCCHTPRYMGVHCIAGRHAALECSTLHLCALDCIAFHCPILHCSASHSLIPAVFPAGCRSAGHDSLPRPLPAAYYL